MILKKTCLEKGKFFCVYENIETKMKKMNILY